MSFDDRQHIIEDEIDLAELVKSIWLNKFILLIFIVLSVPISINYSTSIVPTFKAETVFEKPSEVGNKRNSSELGNFESTGLMRLLGGGTVSGNADSFFSEVRSESFLKTVIFDNSEIDSQMLQRFCPLPSKETSRFSLRSLLISLGLSENRAPSESQKMSLLVQCINEMLEIDLDNYKLPTSGTTSAYRLSIESGDPNFSANLANQIVEKYFVLHEKKRDQSFQKVKEYLSKVITEAQLEYIEANKLLQQFNIKNTLLMNINPISDQGLKSTGLSLEKSIPDSPFVPELNKEIASLSQLEKSLNQLKKASLNLSKLKEQNQANIKKFISSTDVQGVLSRTFITAISKMNNLSAGTSIINREITKIVNQELITIKQQIQILEEKVGKLEEQTMKLMSIENRFQELAIDVAKKKLIFEGLKDQLKEKIFAAGLDNIEQPVLLTKAVPPFSKASPNKKLIVVLGVLLSISAGIAYILIRQLFLRRVHSLSQIKKISRFLNCYVIKYKQLKLMPERSDESVIGQSFFSHTMGMGKLGCIIDLSQKSQNNCLAAEFSKTVANLLVVENSKIVCLDASPSKKPFSSSTQKNFSPNDSDLSVQRISHEKILSVSDDDRMIESGEIKKIKSKYSDYDKIICTLGAEIGDLTKFKFIEQCDFYILIGRSFQFDEYTYKKFSNTVWEKEKKCLGFFLIN